MRRCAGGERESRRDKGTEAIVKQSNGNQIYLSVLAETGGEEVKNVVLKILVLQFIYMMHCRSDLHACVSMKESRATSIIIIQGNSQNPFASIS